MSQQGKGLDNVGTICGTYEGVWCFL